MAEYDRQPNRAYAAVKPQIDRDFPRGRFVAVENGQVVGDAATHRQLVEKLHADGKRIKSLLIVQAGVDYPDSAVILVHGGRS